MIHIPTFIDERGVKRFKAMSNDELKEIIERDKELLGIPNEDINVLLEQFRKDDFLTYCRDNEWEYSYTKILNNDGDVKELDTRIADFRFINKWGQKSENSKYRIIVDDNCKILWIGAYDEKQYFISSGNKIYGFKYEHKYIDLYPNILSSNDYFNEENNEINDALINQYRKNIGWYRFGTIDDAKNIFEKEKIGASISIDEHFEKGFFYKGLKWNETWKYYFGYDYITIFIDIIVKNNLFCIEIENITYPFYGYLLLDLDKLKIIEAGKY
jgi:hypothetical protein